MADNQSSERKVIVAVNGYPRSGKDTFVEFAMAAFNNLGWNTSSVSSIDPVKDITRAQGIPDEPKTPEKRALWAGIKAAYDNYDWFLTGGIMEQRKCYMGTAQSFTGKPQVSFIHVREPEAIRFMESMKEECEFATVFIDRPDAERVTSNESDMNVENYNYDYTIHNSGTLEFLRSAALTFALMISGSKS